VSLDDEEPGNGSSCCGVQGRVDVPKHLVAGGHPCGRCSGPCLRSLSLDDDNGIVRLEVGVNGGWAFVDVPTERKRPRVALSEKSPSFVQCPLISLGQTASTRMLIVARHYVLKEVFQKRPRRG
jgi:hypothetical protein